MTWLLVVSLGLACVLAGLALAVMKLTKGKSMDLTVDDDVRTFLLLGYLRPYRMAYRRTVERTLGHFAGDRFRVAEYWRQHADELREAAVRLDVRPNCIGRDGRKVFWSEKLAESCTQPAVRG